MNRLVNGVYTYSDSYLKKLTKKELIEHLRTIEKNWIHAEETINNQIENSKRLLEEERNKALDDCYKKATEYIDYLSYKNQTRGNGKTMRVYLIYAMQFIKQAVEQLKKDDNYNYNAKYGIESRKDD